MVSLDLNERSHRSEYSIDANNLNIVIQKLDDEEQKYMTISGDYEGPKAMGMITKESHRSDPSPRNLVESDLAVAMSPEREGKLKRLSKAQIKAKVKKAQKIQ